MLLLATNLMGQKRRIEHSRGHSFEFSVGAGYGSLGYGLQSVEGVPMMDGLEAKVTGDWAASAHLGYNYFFVEWVGIGVGVDVTRLGSRLSLNGTQKWQNVWDTDTPQEQYDHIMTLSSWREIQQTYYLEIPVALKFSVPTGPLFIIGEVGGKYGIPLAANYSASGVTTHVGYYPNTNSTLQNEPPHGFYTQDSYQPKGDLLKPTNRFAVYGKLGVLIPLVDQLDLMVQAYGQYSVTGSAIGGESVPGYQKDMPDMQVAHYFMSDYTTYLQSPLTTEKTLRPWMVGLEVGIRYTIPHSTRAKLCPCRLFH